MSMSSEKGGRKNTSCKQLFPVECSLIDSRFCKNEKRHTFSKNVKIYIFLKKSKLEFATEP